MSMYCNVNLIEKDFSLIGDDCRHGASLTQKAYEAYAHSVGMVSV